MLTRYTATDELCALNAIECIAPARGHNTTITNMCFQQSSALNTSTCTNCMTQLHARTRLVETASRDMQ